MQPSFHRPTQATVKLSHIAYNIDQVCKSLPSAVKRWVVVKANAYGHGAVPVACYLADKVDGFCVSNLDEALELREAGLTLPILVLGVVPVVSVPIALAEGIALTVASQAWLDLALVNFDLTGLKVHLKVDSGMGRIGESSSSVINDMVQTLTDKGAIFEGIFTHFATADEENDQHFQTQLVKFQTIVANLPLKPQIIHASNSAASIWHAETVMNAVRLGNVIYGLNPSGRLLDLPYQIKSALTLKSELIHVKEVSPGATIGYGATYKSSATEFIGTLPIGYADGLTRDMQGFQVLIDGQSCPIVGRVSMDQITVRLPKFYPLGTEATLIGSNGKAEITVQDWADQCNTINYEVICLLSDRIPRNYED